MRTTESRLRMAERAEGSVVKILNDTDGRFTVEMTTFEAFVCRAALREVLYGFGFPDFEPRMGCSRKDAGAVLEALPRSTITGSLLGGLGWTYTGATSTLPYSGIHLVAGVLMLTYSPGMLHMWFKERPS
jgi:hypothetical protein